MRPGGETEWEPQSEFSEAGRGVLKQSVRPTICDFEIDKGDWFSRYLKPFNPEEEETEDDEKEEKKDEAEEDQEEATREQGGEPEEARRAKGTKVPIKPSQEEVEEHMLTHLPFRSWCSHCVRGKAKGKPHKKKEEEDKEVPTIALD